SRLLSVHSALNAIVHGNLRVIKRVMAVTRAVIDLRHRTPRHALRTATMRSSAKYNPCALQSVLQTPQVPRPMQMSPALLQPVTQVTYGLS
ncbi:hypothetical protein N7530_008818, partial [Penicillium desertorum]